MKVLGSSSSKGTITLCFRNAHKLCYTTAKDTFTKARLYIFTMANNKFTVFWLEFILFLWSLAIIPSDSSVHELQTHKLKTCF